MSKLKHAHGDDHHVTWWCLGCQTSHSIPVTGPKAWGWNGSSEAPTFTPSILVHEHPALDGDNLPFQTPRCHVFITNGVIDFLSDCTHPLAGCKMPMVEWRGYNAEDYQ